MCVSQCVCFMKVCGGLNKPGFTRGQRSQWHIVSVPRCREGNVQQFLQNTPSYSWGSSQSREALCPAVKSSGLV